MNTSPAIGFIGTGNMGGALAKAVAKKFGGKNLYLADFNKEKAKETAIALGANLSTNEEIAHKCEYIFLGVKPQMMADMLSTLKSILSARNTEFTLISMAAGIPAAMDISVNSVFLAESMLLSVDNISAII